VTDLRRPLIDQSRRVRGLLFGGLVLAGALAISGGPAWAQEAEQTVGSPAAVDSADETMAGGIDGTWTIDTEIGDFADYSGSWAGFRVAEVLQGLGDVYAVGRTPVVTGTLEAEGSTIQNAVIEVDLTTVTSDQPRRDPAIQRALDTVTFPTATLATRGPVDLGTVPVDGEPFAVTLPGTLTIRGISQDVDIPLTGQRVGDIVVVVGTLPVDFTSFDVTMPTAPIVLSVQETGDLEWQLFFRRQAEPAASGEPEASAANEG
jgi:polyisoprenoid-binding protein YceI